MRAPIDLWLVDLDAVASARGNELGDSLPPSERARGNRFREGSACRRFLASREALRRILSDRYGLVLGDVELAYGPRGKPGLGRAEHLGIHFSLAHCAENALIATTTRAPTGVDIERIRWSIDVDRIAARFFAFGEAQRLANLPPHEKTRAFFSCWARKEALVKANGDGFTSFRAFEITCWPAPARVLAAPDGARMWSLSDLKLPGDMVGAVAMNACDAISAELFSWSWPGA
jgi:4'-phosphopantetheinyl transferase